MSSWLYKHQKALSIVLIIIFVISLLPIFLIAKYDCASGDDYNYGAAAHQAYLATGSVISSIKAAIDTTRSTYYSWQGTWFDCFVFCLHPEVFSDSAYFLVPYIFVILQIICYMYFAHHFIKERLKLGNLFWLETALFVLMIGFQLVPSQKSAFFWWVGSVHYAMPMCMALLGITYADKFILTHKNRYFILLCVIAALMGGATYPAALLLLLSVFLLWLADFVISKHRNKKNYLLLIPLALEMAGLVISVLSPGNAVRSASDLNEGAVPSGGAVATITKSITFSVTDGIAFIVDKPFVLIAFIGVAILSIPFLKKSENTFSHPLLFVVVMFLLNASIYAPRLYAGGVVSSGYYNFNFWTFFICGAACIIYLIGYIVSIPGVHRQYPSYLIVLSDLIVILIVLVIAFLGRHSVKTYTDYICMDYYLSGQADDYKEQMDLQRSLMEAEGVEDVVVPQINDEQGPLMHMPIVADPENIDNYMTRIFYGKKSCRSIPRDEWMELYGK